ncbi:PP2C family protein-serine/threonine phosphatase [Planctomycetota bacterium]
MDKNSVSSESPDLQLAAAVQQALLIGDIPECECGKMALKNRMSGLVGGDFYYFSQLGQGQVAFTIGDVVGHGVPAALVMTLIIGHLRADKKNCRWPSRIVSNINDQLVRLGELCNTPITCSIIYGLVDLPTGMLLYVNAGHPHPIIYHRGDDKTRRLHTTTMLLGVQSGILPESCHQFRQQDRLMLYTDGIIEARDSREELFGMDRLRQIVRHTKMDLPEHLADRVFKEIDDFLGSSSPEDDQTLVVIDFDVISNNI